MPHDRRPETANVSVLVVEPDLVFANLLCNWLDDLDAKVVLARSAREAVHLLHDVAFIGCTLDAMLVAHNLQEATGCRIVSEFRFEYPWAPVAVMTEVEDIAVNVWAKSRDIQILRKPLQIKEISLWLGSVAVGTLAHPK